MPIGLASNERAASATVLAVNVLDLVRCMFMVFLQLGRVGKGASPTRATYADSHAPLPALSDLAV
jgi:hypothetical protein